MFRQAASTLGEFSREHPWMTLILGFSAIGAVVTLARGYPKYPGFATGASMVERPRALYPVVNPQAARYAGYHTSGNANVIRPAYGQNWME